MAIALIAANGGTVNGGTSLSFTLDLGTGPNRAVVVEAAEFASIDLSAGTVTVGGVSMGSAVVVSPNVSNNRGFGWVIPVSLTGTQTVVITPPSAAYIDAIASSWSDVDQTTPQSAVASYSNTFTDTPQTLAISVGAGGVAVDLMARRTSGSSTTPDASQTRLHSEISSGGIGVTGGSYKAGATQMSWTHAGFAGVSHVIVALKQAGASGPTITSQPSNQTVTAGSTATFSVTATSSGGALSYQWQRSTNSGGSWSNVSTGTGGTSATYTTATTTVGGGNANNGDQYRCNVTDSNGTTATSAASLTVNAAVATGASMSGPSSGVVGAASSNFTLTLIPAGGTSAGVTYTPSSGGGGGTFTPSSVTLSTGTPSGTFTYTPASAGVKTISVTNGGGLTNPSNISFTASATSTKGGAILGLLAGKVL